MKSVESFLKEIGFVQAWADMEIIEEAFLEDMRRGLEGEKSSMPMLPAYLTIDALAEESRDVIVMDAGGTNLRVALVRLEPGQKPKVLSFQKQPMPGKALPLEKEAFFDALAKAVAPVADKSDRIGFCFSFPCRILPSLDGEIIYLDKEIRVNGIEGALVADGLRRALCRLNVKHDHRVVVLNDTVAALLGALAEHPAARYSGHIGIILGTGTNCCYVEQNSRVLKDEALRRKAGGSIINMEAGLFNGMSLTRADVLVSKGAVDPERNLMEKMVSGEYQGRLMGALLRCAADAGCLSQAVSERLSAVEGSVTSADISLYMDAPARPGLLHDLAPKGADALAVYALADALLERAAMLTTMNLTAIMRFTGAGTNPLLPVCVAVEGTTYEKNECFRQKVRANLIDYTQRERGFHCRVMSTEDANLAGSAMAAATL